MAAPVEPTDTETVVDRPSTAPGLADIHAGTLLRPLGALSSALVGLVWASVAFSLLHAGAIVFDMPHLLAWPIGGPVSALLALGGSTVGLAWLVVAIVWMHRARSNADHIEPSTAWGPGWAVGAWFVPIGYLVLGFFILREIWTRTFGTRAPGWLLASWLLWSVPLGVEHAAGLLQGKWLQLGLPSAYLPVALRVASAVSNLAAAVLFTRFVHEVATAQDAAVPQQVNWAPSVARAS